MLDLSLLRLSKSDSGPSSGGGVGEMPGDWRLGICSRPWASLSTGNKEMLLMTWASPGSRPWHFILVGTASFVLYIIIPRGATVALLCLASSVSATLQWAIPARGFSCGSKTVCDFHVRVPVWQFS